MKQILERWQQYLEKLLNPETKKVNKIKPLEGPLTLRLPD